MFITMNIATHTLTIRRDPAQRKDPATREAAHRTAIRASQYSWSPTENKIASGIRWRIQALERKGLDNRTDGLVMARSPTEQQTHLCSHMFAAKAWPAQLAWLWSQEG